MVSGNELEFPTQSIPIIKNPGCKQGGEAEEAGGDHEQCGGAHHLWGGRLLALRHLLLLQVERSALSSSPSLSSSSSTLSSSSSSSSSSSLSPARARRTCFVTATSSMGLLSTTGWVFNFFFKRKHQFVPYGFFFRITRVGQRLQSSNLPIIVLSANLGYWALLITSYKNTFFSSFWKLV